MTSPASCPECASPVVSDAPEALCPGCLMQIGLEPAPALDTVGDYELLEEIARGGMGIVYRARQVSLGRIVAVKMLLAGRVGIKDFVQRFRTESSAAASLQHPNIVAIHEVGFADGQHFFAMDFVEGLTLGQLVAKGPLPTRHAATY